MPNESPLAGNPETIDLDTGFRDLAYRLYHRLAVAARAHHWGVDDLPTDLELEIYAERFRALSRRYLAPPVRVSFWRRLFTRKES